MEGLFCTSTARFVFVRSKRSRVSLASRCALTVPRTFTAAKTFDSTVFFGTLLHPVRRRDQVVSLLQSIENCTRIRGNGPRGAITPHPQVFHTRQPKNRLRNLACHKPQTPRSRNNNNSNTATLPFNLKGNRMGLATSTLPAAASPLNWNNVQSCRNGGFFNGISDLTCFSRTQTNVPVSIANCDDRLEP